jgi:hypothetical protein
MKGVQILRLKEITDKDLIVYLNAIGFQIKDIKKDKNQNRSIVYFEDTNELKEAIIRYVNKSDSINICEFLSAEKRVKTLLCMQKC